jgi:hypothetical protein
MTMPPGVIAGNGGKMIPGVGCMTPGFGIIPPGDIGVDPGLPIGCGNVGIEA